MGQKEDAERRGCRKVTRQVERYGLHLTEQLPVRVCAEVPMAVGLSDL